MRQFCSFAESFSFVLGDDTIQRRVFDKDALENIIRTSFKKKMKTLPQKDEQAADQVQSKGSPEGLNMKKIESHTAENVVTVEATSGASEILAGMEGSEINEKDHSISEKKSNTSQASSASSKKNEDAIRSHLSKGVLLPTQKIMVRKVKTALHHEVKQVHKQVKKLKRNSIRFAHELAKAFQKLKTLKYLLKNITTFALDFVQMLFEKVQKNESLAQVTISE